MISAVEGYREGQKEAWERVRWTGYFSLAPYQKKGFSIESIWIPIDPIPEQKITEVKKLSPEEIQEIYRKSGFEISKEDSLKLANNEILA